MGRNIVRALLLAIATTAFALGALAPNVLADTGGPGITVHACLAQTR